MHLKRIELTGFKSFVDKTNLSFEPGITAVVGPNGSGKSNISDAVRWVLGEMSVKLLRGAKMEDVIFSGTQKRKPVNFAEVSLTLDNEDHTFPLDFSEVTITRRVYRSAESEYYINNSPCRLKDIHELFMDTGLGRDGYSIIGQGKISEIISSKSEERRSIFDEAVGISKYRHRKQEAIRKLDATKENLIRINDIVSELEDRLDPLQKQSLKAKKYLSLREELKQLEVNVSIRILEKSKATILEYDKKFMQVTEEIAELERNEELEENKVRELTDNLHTLNQRLQECEKSISEALIEIKGLEGETDVIKNSYTNSQSEKERLHSEIMEQKAKVEEQTALKKQLEEELASKNEVLKEFKSKTDQLGDSVLELNLKISENSNTINSLKTDIIEKLNDIANKKAQISSYEAFKSNFIERKDVLSNELEILEIRKIETEAKINSNREKLHYESENANNLNHELIGLAQRIEKLKQKQIQALKELELKREKFNSTGSRLNMLKELERDYEGYTKSVKTVLEAYKKGRLSCKICGALSALIKVDKKYVTAVEIALAGTLQNIVVETPEDAKVAIGFLKQSSSGRATFLPITSIKPRELANKDQVINQKGFIGVASELVDYDKKYQGIIKNLLGTTVVVDNIDNGIAISKKFAGRFKIVTLEGDVFSPGGSMSGGSINKTAGILSRATVITEFEGKVKQLKNEVDRYNLESANIRAALESETEKANKTTEKLNACRQQVALLKAEGEHLAAQKEGLDKNRLAVIEEERQIREQIDQTNDQIAIIINQTTKDEFYIEEAQNRLSEMEAQVAKVIEERDNINASLMEESVGQNSVKKDIEAISDRVLGVEITIAEINAAIDKKNAAVLGICENEKELSAKEQKIQENILKIKENIAGLKVESEKITALKAGMEEDIKLKGELAKELRQKVYLLKEEQNRIDSKRVREQLEVDNTSERLWEDYELTYTTALEYKDEKFSNVAAQRRIKALKEEIRGLGNINIDAIEEYKEVKSRFEFLLNQRNDLEAAKENLEGLINDITKQMEALFKEQFKIINNNFSIVFKQLFSGGNAELRLSDPSDVLESGIEIDAQPPGKKLQSINLLSGGEKALTAISLLFAILKVRPTPFCILDEIESALDEPNVYRFGEFLKEYSKKTQFIVVTHRRGTMEAADLLYGVTMQEQGVSKLLSLKIEDVDNL